MKPEIDYQVKFADTESEFRQIASLNYATFVEEIPQHGPNADKLLTDKFHRENVYIICKLNEEITGMVALRNQRPFSLDAKLPNLDQYLESGESLCEIRLLAIQPRQRHGRVFFALMSKVFAYCAEMNFDRGLISGRIENLGLYEKLGFRAFGPRVGVPGALYQPMAITRKTLNGELALMPEPYRQTFIPDSGPYYFTPGPVGLRSSVKQVLVSSIYSHRSEQYLMKLQEVKRRLTQMTGTQAVEILMGTGTLANEVVASHLVDLEGEGLILANGEFGNRLVNHAEKMGLHHQVLRAPWGEPINLDALEFCLQSNRRIRWLWAVHCETSTGQVLPIESVQNICDRFGVETHWDAISSLGSIPCDFGKARMATSVVGKGIGALTGMALVFYRADSVVPGKSHKPSYLDLREYIRKHGIPFSGSSLLLEALLAALRIPRTELWSRRDEMAQWLANRLSQSSIQCLGAGPNRAPGIFTLQLPEGISSFAWGRKLEAEGLICNYASDYLSARNWLQICLMGEVSWMGLRLLWQRIETEFRRSLICAGKALHSEALSLE